jgi:hypothetical protein
MKQRAKGNKQGGENSLPEKRYTARHRKSGKSPRIV